MPSPHRLVLDPYKLVLAPVYTGWRAVGWVWLPTAKNVAEFLAEEARLHRLPLEASDFQLHVMDSVASEKLQNS